MTKKIRVALIFGGKSGEHEVSLASAKSVARALDKNKYDVTLIGITKEGQWLSGGNPLKELISKTQSPLLNSGLNGEAVANENARRDLATAEQMVEKASPLHSVDVVFPLVHGPMGEDGTIQGLLELADMAYVGAGVAASAASVAMAASIALPPFLRISRPIWAARGTLVATIPCVATTGERVANTRPSGRSAAEASPRDRPGIPGDMMTSPPTKRSSRLAAESSPNSSRARSMSTSASAPGFDVPRSICSS